MDHILYLTYMRYWFSACSTWRYCGCHVMHMSLVFGKFGIEHTSGRSCILHMISMNGWVTFIANYLSRPVVCWYLNLELYTKIQYFLFYSLRFWAIFSHQSSQRHSLKILYYLRSKLNWFFCMRILFGVNEQWVAHWLKTLSYQHEMIVMMYMCHI